MSAVDYLRMFTQTGYRITVLDKQSGRIDGGTDANLVMKVFENADDSHIDLMFECI